MKPLRYHFGILLLATGFFLQGCMKEELDLGRIEETTWDPHLAIPLINSSFTIKDLLLEADKRGQVVTDPTSGLCSLVYKGQLQSPSGAEFIILPDQNFQAEYVTSASDANNINTLPLNGTYLTGTSTTLTFEPDTDVVYIDELTLSSGELVIDITSTINQNVLLTVTVPAAQKNGQVFQQAFPIPAANNTPFFQQIRMDMGGYVVDLTQGGTTFNTVTCNYTVQVTKTAASIQAGQRITMNNRLEDLRFSLIKGDFGQQRLFSIDDRDTINLSLFKNVIPDSGEFRLNHAIANLRIENGYGIPLRIDTLLLQPYGSGQTFPYPYIPTPPGYTPLNLSAPSVPGQSTVTIPPSIGGPNATELNAIINAKPKNLIYALEALSNPNGPPTQGNRNFITDTGRVRIRFDILMPLDGGAWNFTFRDTTSFDLGRDFTGYLSSAELRSITTNGFPFDVEMNIDFADADFNILHTLEPDSEFERVIQSARIDANGDVTQPTVKTTRFLLHETEAGLLKDVRHIIVRAKGSTTNNGVPDVKIYDHYKLDFKLGMKGTFNFPVQP